MKAINSTALPLLVGLGLALPAAAAAAQERIGADGVRYAAIGEPIAGGGQRFPEFAGGEEETVRDPFPDATVRVQAAEAAARQQAQGATAPATGAQDERLRMGQAAPAPAPAAGRGPLAGVTPAATGVRTDGVEIGLTEDTIQGTFFTDAGRIGVPGGGLALSLLLSEDRDLVASGSLMVPIIQTNIVPGPLSLSVGAKAFGAFLADPSDDVFAIAPGVEGRYALPFGGIPMGIVTNVFYAPEILTFGEADNVLDFNIRFEAQFTQSVVGFVGYRLLEFDRDGGDDQIVENVQFGVRFAF